MRIFERLDYKQEIFATLQSSIGSNKFACREGENSIIELLECQHYWLNWLNNGADFVKVYSFDLKLSILFSTRFNNFENDTIKISVNEAELTGLSARNCATIQQVLILNFAFGPESYRAFRKTGPWGLQTGGAVIFYDAGFSEKVRNCRFVKVSKMLRQLKGQISAHDSFSKVRNTHLRLFRPDQYNTIQTLLTLPKEGFSVTMITNVETRIYGKSKITKLQ